jgi:hypothetical protein
MDKSAMAKYAATEANTAKKYGRVVRALAISNREYQHRYDKLFETREMKPPPSSGRIFPGYLVVRKLNSPHEYETWIPDHAFEEVYEKLK